ncbi:MAG: DUF4476 domain-containing protein [Cystobacter sp.]
MRPSRKTTSPMRTLLASLALITSFAAAAQNHPPSGQGTGSSPPGSSRADEQSYRGGGRRTPVVVDRDELEQRLSRLESILRNAERGGGRVRLDEAYRELSGLRSVVANAPDARGYDSPPPRPQPQPQPPPRSRSSISEPRLRDILTSMGRESFADNKLRVLESGLGGESFLVDQVARVVEQFSFSADKLAAVRLLWPRVLDTQNSHRLHGLFSFSEDKKELQRIISR